MSSKEETILGFLLLLDAGIFFGSLYGLGSSLFILGYGGDFGWSALTVFSSLALVGSIFVAVILSQRSKDLDQPPLKVVYAIIWVVVFSISLAGLIVFIRWFFTSGASIGIWGFITIAGILISALFYSFIVIILTITRLVRKK